MELDQGDIIKVDKPLSNVSKHECVIGHSDPTFVVLFSLPDFGSMFILPVEEFKYLNMIKKGRGILEDEHKTALAKAMEGWAYKPLFSTLDWTIGAVKKATKCDSPKSVHISVSGFVAEPLALQWKQMLAMGEIYKTVNPSASEVQARLLEWMLIAVFGMITDYESLRNSLKGESNG